MRAWSTCSHQRPDTLMQDRIARIEETSCTARPDHTRGQKIEKQSCDPMGVQSIRHGHVARAQSTGAAPVCKGNDRAGLCWDAQRPGEPYREYADLMAHSVHLLLFLGRKSGLSKIVSPYQPIIGIDLDH